jgi:hypothetical protein
MCYLDAIEVRIADDQQRLVAANVNRGGARLAGAPTAPAAMCD